MATQQPQQPRRTTRISLRTAFLLLLIGLLCAFALGNSQMVQVWPFRWNVPLFAVVLGCFGIGLLTGWIGRGVLAGRRRAPAPETPQAAQTQQ